MNMLNKIQAKIKEKLHIGKGFSFSEMLVCTLILLLSTGLVTSTLSLGIQQFKEQSSNTDKQILLNTLTLAIRDELSYVTWVDTEADGQITKFKSTAILALQDKECSLIVDDSGKVVISYDEGTYPLVADDNYGKGEYIVTSLSKKEENNQFVVTLTIANADGTGERTEVFMVKPINKNALSAAGHINDNPTGTGDTSTGETPEGEEQVYE